MSDFEEFIKDILDKKVTEFKVELTKFNSIGSFKVCDKEIPVYIGKIEGKLVNGEYKHIITLIEN